MPHTAHPAFDKAGLYFGIDMVHVPVEAPDFRVDPQGVASRINANAIAIYGVAGNLEGNQVVTEMVYGVFDHLYAV